jgi:hypothetical protein
MKKRGVLHHGKENDSIAVGRGNRRQLSSACSDDMAAGKGMPKLHGASDAEYGEEFDAARH